MSTFANLRLSPSGGFFLTTLCGLLVVALQGQTLYDFGDPNGDEQLYIELINRARANPPAEGARLAASTDPEVLSAYSYFNIDLAMMQEEFNAITAQPPVAPNANLITAARSHSAWMLANQTQSHNETNPSNTPFTRMTAAGYSYNSAGENIFARAKSSWHGHAGFQVDWGDGGTGGMQSGRGHRANIHSATFREIGVGVALGSNGTVGPHLVTQDFGYRSSAPSFGTGVAYYDLNENNFYDTGEGISGLTVNVAGTSSYCVTAAGGGWTVPIPSSAATRVVSFSGLGVNQTVNLVVPASKNAKADLKLTYTPPGITSSASAYTGVAHSLTFTAVAGATGYQWKRWDLNATPVENCESTASITTSTSGSYGVLNTTVKQQGAASFHLENSTGTSQSIELNNFFYGGTSPSLSFQSRVRTSSSSEHFKVQIRQEGSTLWQDVYDQTGGTSENSFSLRNATLTGMTGKLFHVRFVLNFISGTYWPYSGDSYGWFIDAISFANVSTVTNPVSQLLTGTSGSFTPSAVAHLISVAPVISGFEFPASYQILTAPKIVVEEPVGTDLVDGAAALAFGSANIGTPVTKTVTVRNTGTANLTGLAVSRSGANASDFALGALGASTLAPGANTTFTVTFTPAAAGSRSAALQIASNDANENPFDITLAGTGVAVDPNTIAFVGTPYDLRVGNKAAFDLNRLLAAGETVKVKGKLPSGLKFNASTGMLAGTLAGKPGTYQAVIQVLQGKTIVRTIAFPITVLDFPSSLIGNFDCILEDANSIPSGAFRLIITKANQWSATLESAGATKIRKAKGTFILGEGTPVAPISVVFPADSGAPAVTVNISIDGSTPNQTGTYNNGTLRGFRLASAAQSPPATVACNLVFDAGVQDGITIPAGLGWMKGKVSNKGTGTFKGLLGDGAAASFTLRVSACGQAVLWSQPYKNKNSFIGGIVTLGNLGQATPSEPLLSDGAWWAKSAEASTLSYPGGFPAMPVTLGTSKWITPASATALGASLGWRDNRKAEVIIDGAGLNNQEPQATAAALPTEFTLDDKFALIPSLPISTPLVAWEGSVSKTDGGMSGALTLPSGFSADVPVGGTAAASGVLVQDESWGTVTGCGLVKIPSSGPKGSFRTSAFVLGQ